MIAMHAHSNTKERWSLPRRYFCHLGRSCRSVYRNYSLLIVSLLGHGHQQNLKIFFGDTCYIFFRIHMQQIYGQKYFLLQKKNNIIWYNKPGKIIHIQKLLPTISYLKMLSFLTIVRAFKNITFYHKYLSANIKVYFNNQNANSVFLTPKFF